MISEADLARLYLSLEGAKLVRDMLSGDGGEIDGFDLDVLADLLSDCPPEKCLLILSCAAIHTCKYLELDAGLNVSLNLLAEDVLDDYAPMYLAHLKGDVIDPYEAQIIYMQEDLEAFSELFALIGELCPTDSVAYHVCAVLSDQALAQAEFLDVQDCDIDYAVEIMTTETPSLILFTDNVVPFPGLYKKN